MIEQYLESLRCRLPGPHRAREELLSELGDGLRDAASVYQMHGLSREEAERRVVAESGTAEELAPEYSETLAVTQGRRTAMLYAVGAPVSVLAWSLVWSLPGPVAGVAEEQSPVALLCWSLIDYAGITAGIAALCALGMLVLSGRRGWSSRGILLLQAALGIGYVSVTSVCSLIGNVLVDGGALGRTGGLPPLLLTLCVASGIVIAWQGVSSWRTIRVVRALRTIGVAPSARAPGSAYI